MSVDLLMFKGDLGITKDKAGNFDLVLEEAGQSLLRRTVITPPSWIAMWCIENNNVVLIDEHYGDKVYQQLSDSLNKEWIAKAKTHIQQSLHYIKDEERIEITSTSIGIASSNSFNPDTANIQINFTYEGQSRTYSEQIRL